MLVLLRRKDDALLIGEGAKTITVNVIAVNKWRWWKWWKEATVVLKVDGPEGTSAVTREDWDEEHKPQPRVRGLGPR